MNRRLFIGLGVVAAASLASGLALAAPPAALEGATAPVDAPDAVENVHYRRYRHRHGWRRRWPRRRYWRRRRYGRRRM